MAYNKLWDELMVPICLLNALFAYCPISDQAKKLANYQANKLANYQANKHASWVGILKNKSKDTHNLT